MTLQLGIRHRRLLDAAQLFDDEVDHFADHFVRAARVNRERPGVAVRAQPAEHGVGQAAFLTHVLEEPRAHRSAEHRVQHVARIAVVVILRVAAGAETEVALLQLFVADENLRRHRRRLFADRLARRWHRREPLFDELADVIVLEVADRRDDQVGRGVRAVEVVAKQVGGERLDRFARPENRPPQRMVGPESLREELVDEVVRHVLDHLDLFDHDLLLALDIVGCERRVPYDVGEDVDGEREVFVEDFDVVARVFLGGEGVELAADRVDRLRDVFRRPRCRALEEHVLDEMRDAAALRRLVPRSPGQPHADADRTHLRHPLRQETNAVAQNVSDDR